MKGAGGKNSWALFLLLLTGIVLGGFIGMLAEGVPALSWLGYGQTLSLIHIQMCIRDSDNDTLQGWYQALKEEDKEMALEYIGNRFTPEADIHWDYIRLAMRSVADTCIIPVQDYLGLGCEARINTPSTLGGNWIWRSDADSFTDNLAAKIKKITQLCARSLQQKGE